MNILDHLSQSLETIFSVKILKFFEGDEDPGIFFILDPASGMEKTDTETSRIRNTEIKCKENQFYHTGTRKKNTNISHLSLCWTMRWKSPLSSCARYRFKEAAIKQEFTFHWLSKQPPNVSR